MPAESSQCLEELKTTLKEEELSALHWLVSSAHWEGPDGEKKHYNAVVPTLAEEGMRRLIRELDEAGIIQHDRQDVPYLVKSDHTYIVLSEKNLEGLGINPHNREHNHEHERAARHFRGLAARKVFYGPSDGSWKKQ